MICFTTYLADVVTACGSCTGQNMIFASQGLARGVKWIAPDIKRQIVGCCHVTVDLYLGIVQLDAHYVLCAIVWIHVFMV